MAISVLLALAATLNAALPDLPPVPEGALCVSGLCAGPAQGRMPGGLMYLAVGLVWLGAAGLRREQRRRRGRPAGVP